MSEDLVDNDDGNLSVILSVREREVLRWYSFGLKNRQIAEKMGITEKTVETHRKNIKKKNKMTPLALIARSALLLNDL